MVSCIERPDNESNRPNGKQLHSHSVNWNWTWLCSQWLNEWAGFCFNDRITWTICMQFVLNLWIRRFLLQCYGWLVDEYQITTLQNHTVECAYVVHTHTQQSEVMQVIRSDSWRQDLIGKKCTNISHDHTSAEDWNWKQIQGRCCKKKRQVQKK